MLKSIGEFFYASKTADKQPVVIKTQTDVIEEQKRKKNEQELQEQIRKLEEDKRKQEEEYEKIMEDTKLLFQRQDEEEKQRVDDMETDWNLDPTTEDVVSFVSSVDSRGEISDNDENKQTVKQEVKQNQKDVKLAELFEKVYFDISRNHDVTNGHKRLAHPIVLYQTSKSNHCKVIYKSIEDGKVYKVYTSFKTVMLKFEPKFYKDYFQHALITTELRTIQVPVEALNSDLISISPPHIKTKQAISSVDNKSKKVSPKPVKSPGSKKQKVIDLGVKSPIVKKKVVPTKTCKVHLIYISCRHVVPNNK